MLSIVFRNGKILFPYQDEIENLSLKNVGSCDNIYFDKIPFGKNHYLLFNRKENAWEMDM